MQKWLFRAALAALALSGCKKSDDNQPAFAAISGVVTDEATGMPLQNVTVNARSPSSSGMSTTGVDGKYRVQNLLAGVDYSLVATTDNYMPVSATLKTIEGENTHDFALRRARVCTPAEKHCAVAPAPAAILTCNSDGTAYTSAPCNRGEMCDLATTTCLAQATITARIVHNGTGDGSISSVPAGIQCPPQCDASFPAGTQITFTATPDAQSRFSNFGNACLNMMGGPNMNQCTITAMGTQVVSALFASTAPGIAVSKAGMGMGTVTSEPPGINCGNDCGERFAAGLAIVLTATPDATSSFAGWVGCDSVPTPTTCNVMSGMTGRQIRATFEPFFLSPLAADARCMTLLHFDAPNRFVQGCGMGSDAVATGTVSFPASRTTALGSAIQQDGPSEAGAIDTMKPGMTANAATIEMTIYVSGPAFGGRGTGVLYSDRADTSSTAGVRFGVEDNGTLFAETYDGAGGMSRAESPAGAVMNATWTHVAATLSRMNGIHVFVDGMDVGNVGGPLALTASSSTAWVGAEREAGASINRFNGRIDEFRLSNNRRY